MSVEDDDVVDLPPVRDWDHDSWPFGNPTPDAHWAIFQMELMDSIMSAQASFREFARQADLERFRIVPAYEVIAIKAFFVHENTMPFPGEHIFLSDISTDGKQVTGTLNADSHKLPQLREGKVVTFPLERVSDWFLVRQGKGLGGFTIPHVWKSLSPSEQRAYAHAPPFSWFAHRGEQTAEDQLMALPKCTQCHRRDIGNPDSQATLCDLCSQGWRRCDCPGCGAPLIRSKAISEKCARCKSKR